MGYYISEVRVGDLQVDEEKRTHTTEKFVQGSSETMGHMVYLANTPLHNVHT